jgi:hypothetical protein
MYPFDAFKILMLWVGIFGSVGGLEHGFEQGNWFIFAGFFCVAIMAIVFKDEYPEFVKDKPKRCK